MRPPFRAIVLALVVLTALLAVPAALGAVRPDDKASPLDPAVAAAIAATSSPADQAGVIGVGKVSAESEPVRSFTGERDLGLFRSDGSIVVPLAAAVAVEESTGTDWGTIAVGAAVVALLVVAAGAVVEIARHHGGPAKPIPH